MSIATQASCLLCYFFAWFIHSFVHSLLQTYKQMETSTLESPVHSLDRLQATQAQRSACLGTSAGWVSSTEHSGKPMLSDCRGLRSPCFSWISHYFNLTQWRIILSSLLKELPPESVLWRKTAHLCSANRREVEKLHSVPLGQDGSGKPGSETQQNPWQPFTVQAQRLREGASAVHASSQQSTLHSGITANTQWKGVLSSHPSSAASLGYLSSLSPVKNEETPWEKRRRGVLKVGTTRQCTSHGCTEASRELSQVWESKHSHRELPLDFPIHDSRPSQGPFPLPSMAAPLPLPMPLTFKLSYLKSFDFAQDVVLWHCLNCLLTFCSPIRDKNTVMGKCPGSHRIVEGPGMQIMCFILLGW